jgi:hypothetical protein
MKTPEDEAFEEIERRQGGGFPAKRTMAADKLHWSDCAVHNGPAYPAGPCDCGVEKESDALTIAYQSGYYDGKKAALAKREWNFCERCGKRTADKTVIHTCTPPQEKNG